MYLHTAEQNTHLKPYRVGEHSHKYYELVFYISGSGYIKINKTKHPFCANSFSFSKPDSIHEESSNEPVDLIYIGFSIDNSIDLSDLHNGVYKCNKGSYILSTMKQIVYEMQSKNFYYKNLLGILLTSLIYQIKRNISIDIHRFDTFSEVNEYIKANCTSNIKAIDVAKKFHYNYDYFRKEYFKHYNISVSDMIVQEKINFATNLLRTTKLKISEIAKKSGFSSTSHFVSLFKEHHKVTPKKYIIKDIRV